MGGIGNTHTESAFRNRKSFSVSSGCALLKPEDIQRSHNPFVVIRPSWTSYRTTKTSSQLYNAPQVAKGFGFTWAD
jgi:hypothetical protein